MLVKLIDYTPIQIAVRAIRKCYDSEGGSDEALIRNIIKNDHTSTIEHIKYTFEIDGISRACLQELARHRIASLSVQSTRYTLKKMLRGKSLKDLYVSSGDPGVDQAIEAQLFFLKTYLAVSDEPNDTIKYAIPEAFKTGLVWTINARSLRNFFKLRLSKRAHKEIRQLAKEIVDLLPEEHMILFEDINGGADE